VGTTKHEGFAYNYGKVTQETLKNYLKKSYGGQWEKYWEASGVESDSEALFVRRQDNGDIKMATCYSWVELQNEQKRLAPYTYIFTKEAPGPEGAGAFHSGEHAYVFQTMDKVPWRQYNAGDYELSEVMSSYWVNFMKTGNPNGEGLPTWEPSENMKEDPWVMELGCRVGMVRPPETKVSQFIKEFSLNFYREQK